MPRVMLNRSAALLALAAVTMLPLASCANAGTNSGTTQEDAMSSGVGRMLEEIYASRKPVRFEQIDVSDVVTKYIPLRAEKSTVLEAFGKSATSKIVESTPDKIVVRDSKGKAMLDPDTRSIVMTFFLDADGKVAKVDAVHIKGQ